MGPMAERWADVLLRAPDELRPYLLDFEWEHERLWALRLPHERIAAAELASLLRLRWWRHDGRPFAVSPLEVLEHPEVYPDQYHRVLAADLRHPLEMTCVGERLTVMDGVHRLAKVAALGLPSVAIREVPRAAFSQIRTRDGRCPRGARRPRRARRPARW